MGLRINTNIQALAAQRALEQNVSAQGRSFEKLSSGSRINRAGDDAAGLAISEKLKASIRSMKQATRNANDGIGLIQTAEGAMNEVGNILVRMRELSIQTASDTLGDTERGFVNKEVQALKAEIQRIASSTEFNGHRLLDGTGEFLDFQVGLNNNPEQDRISYDVAMTNSTLEALGVSGVDNATKAASQENLGAIDAAINKVNDNRSGLGALQNRLQSTINNMMIYRENLEAANSRIRDTDVATESSELVRASILSNSTISVLGQANTAPQAALKLVG